MDDLTASEVCIVDGVDEQPVLRARAQRLLSRIRADRVRRVSDEELDETVRTRGLNKRARHGMKPDFLPVIILNRFRLDDPPEVREARKARFPA
ncbi:MAG: hypothetical protein FJ278_16890, partial [Planctomycetes bacterium]|nr:hypothetical protein [Planctomycetota bacterium]